MRARDRQAVWCSIVWCGLVLYGIVCCFSELQHMYHDHRSALQPCLCCLHLEIGQSTSCSSSGTSLSLQLVIRLAQSITRSYPLHLRVHQDTHCSVLVSTLVTTCILRPCRRAPQCNVHLLVVVNLEFLRTKGCCYQDVTSRSRGDRG